MKYELDKKRALSWSAISSFEYDPEQWFDKYVLGKKQEETSAMLFGKQIGERLASDPTFMPEVPRLPVYEYKLTARIGDIPLIGYIDAFDKDIPALLEFKTGKKWDRKKAESHGQIDLYCAMLWAMHKIHPGDLDIKLVWMETEQGGDFSTQFVKGMKPVIFPLKKSMVDVLNMLVRVKKVYAQMLVYTDTHI